MNARSDSAAERLDVYLDQLLGREVLAANNQPIGRLEEFRATQNGTSLAIEEYVIGVSGLFERLGVAMGLLLGRAAGGGYVARWDQLDITDTKHPRLTCRLEELRTR